MLTIAILASGVAFLDGSVVNVALPAIQRSLGGGLALQQWVVDAYAVTLGALMLIAGSLSDLFGRKRVLQWGLAGFLAASLACAAAPSGTMLIVARSLQGAAGALLVPSSLALIISAFDGTAQAKAIGTWTAWTSVGFILGPLAGGLLVDDFSWRFIFAVNVVPVVLTLFLLAKLDMQDKPDGQAAIDVLGAWLCALGLGGLVFALIEQPRWGWRDPLITATLLLGAGIFAAFLAYEARAKKPLLPFSLFEFRNFGAGNAATFFIYASLSASTFLIVLFLQQVSGYSAFVAGLALLPITLLLIALSPRFGALAGRYGPRWFMAAGPMLMSGGAVLLMRVGTHMTYWNEVLPGVALFGFGLSMTVAPLTAAVLGSIPHEEAGIASAVNNAVSRVAGLLAVAIVGALVAAQFRAGFEQRLTAADISLPQSTRQTIEARPLDSQLPGSVPPALRRQTKQAATNASVSALHGTLLLSAVLLAVGSGTSAIGIRNGAGNRSR